MAVIPNWRHGVAPATDGDIIDPDANFRAAVAEDLDDYQPPRHYMDDETARRAREVLGFTRAEVGL